MRQIKLTLQLEIMKSCVPLVANDQRSSEKKENEDNEKDCSIIHGLGWGADSAGQ